MSATAWVGTAILSPCSKNFPDAPGRFTSRNTRTRLSRATFTKKYFTSAKPVPAPNGTSSNWAVRKETASRCHVRLWKNCTASESKDSLKSQNRMENIEHPTSNIELRSEVSEDSRWDSMFGVGCSMLDVLAASWEATTISESRIGAMNLPPTPPEEGSQCRGTLAEFPSWEGLVVGRFMGRPG